MEGVSKTMIRETFIAGSLIINNRNTYQVLGSLVEEVGELSQEVNIVNGGSYKEAGPDGVTGEAVDVILCALDLIRVHNPKITEAEIMEIVHTKLTKWKTKAMEHMVKKHRTVVKERTERHLMPPPSVEEDDTAGDDNDTST